MNRSRALVWQLSGSTILVVNDSAPEELDEHLAILRGMKKDYGARLTVVEWRDVGDEVAETLPPPRPELPTVDDRAVPVERLSAGTTSAPDWTVE